MPESVGGPGFLRHGVFMNYSSFSDLHSIRHDMTRSDIENVRSETSSTRPEQKNDNNNTHLTTN